MIELVGKLAAASEGNRDLDLEVRNTLGGKHPWRWLDRRRETITCERYGPDAVGNPVCSLKMFTTSIDDALSIIPGNFDWFVSKGKLTEGEPLYGVIISHPGNPGTVVAESESDLASIAICIAALMARTVQDRKEPVGSEQKGAES